MRSHMLLIPTMLLVAAALAQVRGRPELDLSQQDKTFMRKAAQGGMAEVAMGSLAIRKGVSAKVRDFGRDMVTDHSKANNDLKSVAADLHFNLPARIGADEAGDIRRLNSMSGRRFDSAYGRMMVADHKMDVAEFEKEVRNGRNPAVRDFARRTLPVLREHLRMAKMLPQ